ncbi:hypothetical protein [Rhizobium leguminosarum]
MFEKTVPSFNIEVHMAGDINAATLFLQQEAARKGMCVTLTPQTFIYSGGREEGFRVGLINYPRFPKTPDELFGEARMIGLWLRAHLGQASFSIVTPRETTWISTKPESAIEAELLECVELLASLEDPEGLLAYPSRADTARARAAIKKARGAAPSQPAMSS